MQPRTPGPVPWPLSRFVPQIRLRVGPEAFVFTSRKTTAQIGTFLYLKDGTAGVRLLSVGEEMPSAPGVVRVDLFANAPTPIAPIEKMDCLEAFCRYGIHKVTARYAMVRPCVTVSGIDSLETVLHGYQVGVLKRVLTASGASMVVFEGLRGSAPSAPNPTRRRPLRA